MKVQFILLILLSGVVGSDLYAGNGNTTDPQTEEQKKEVKPKYDFNIFKLFSMPLHQNLDSLKSTPTTHNKSSLLTKNNRITSTYNRKS